MIPQIPNRLPLRVVRWLADGEDLGHTSTAPLYRLLN
jgi:hypothetical protein